jgi:hypothetical protein
MSETAIEIAQPSTTAVNLLCSQRSVLKMGIRIFADEQRLNNDSGLEENRFGRRE